jgi:SAM-dependent methyltransferase
MKGALGYYVGTSYRRKSIDAALAEIASVFTGQVLDIGGARVRGAFQRSPQARWVVADLDGSRGPDVIADIQALPFGSEVFDVVKATEVLEHVPDPIQSLTECRRVLKPGGRLVLSIPFLERVHADPDDYGRYTASMWTRLLDQAGLRVVTLTPQGGFFTHLAGLFRFLVLRAPAGLRHAGYCVFPLLDLLARLDAVAAVRRSELGSFVNGYFIVALR